MTALSQTRKLQLGDIKDLSKFSQLIKGKAKWDPSSEPNTHIRLIRDPPQIKLHQPKENCRILEPQLSLPSPWLCSARGSFASLSSSPRAHVPFSFRLENPTYFTFLGLATGKNFKKHFNSQKVYRVRKKYKMAFRGPASLSQSQEMRYSDV